MSWVSNQDDRNDTVPKLGGEVGWVGRAGGSINRIAGVDMIDEDFRLEAIATALVDEGDFALLLNVTDALEEVALSIAKRKLILAHRLP